MGRFLATRKVSSLTAQFKEEKKKKIKKLNWASQGENGVVANTENTLNRGVRLCD